MSENSDGNTPVSNSDISSSTASDSNGTADMIAPRRPERRATVRFGLGQRQLSRITLFVVVVILGALGFAAYRMAMGFKSDRDVVIARDNMLALYKAMRGSAQDWDEKLPTAEEWTDKVRGYLSAPPNKPGGKESYLAGPADSGTVGYVYNDLAAGYNLNGAVTDMFGKTVGKKQAEPKYVVLLIERVGALPNSHELIPPTDTPAGQDALHRLLTFPHGSDDPDNARTVVLYANGTIETLTRRDSRQ